MTTKGDTIFDEREVRKRIHKSQLHKPTAGSPVVEVQKLQSRNEDMPTKSPVASKNTFDALLVLDSEDGGTSIESGPEPLELPKHRAREDGSDRIKRLATGRGEPRLYYNRHTPEHPPQSTGLRRDRDELITQYRDLHQRFLKAEVTISEQETQIIGLTEAITRFHQRDGEQAKDDNYLPTQFSDIANSIRQWTLRNFLRDSLVLIKDLNQLPPDLRQSISHAVPSGEELNLLSERATRIRVIGSIVLEYLCRHLFISDALPGATDAGKAMIEMGRKLQGTDFQIQRWRSLTYNLLTKDTDYGKNFHKDVVTLAQSLGKLILALAFPGLGTSQRNDELCKIVEHAARISVELRKQLDIISFDPPKPGAPFDAETMEDLCSIFGPDELMAGGATVQIALCPIILRQSRGSDGSLSPKSLVMKSKVWTVMDMVDDN